jgi:hypothetical protein
MKQAFTLADIELLGYLDPKEEGVLIGAPCQIFTAFTPAPAVLRKRIKTKFIYLKSNCTKSDAEKISKFLGTSEELIVIIPKSIGVTKEALNSIFPKDIYIYEDLIWETIYNTFSDYLNSLKSRIIPEEYYIPPRKEQPDPNFEPSSRDRLDEEIMDYLTGEKNIDSMLLVVSASAGVGKTTLARQLTVGLANKVEANRVIPTYVEASHWGKLKLESVDEFWDIIENSLRNINSGLRLSEKIFEHSLKSGYLVFIFDGFDELCSQRHSQFKPGDILSRLANISKESNAKIIITTRTLFWQTEVFDPPSNVEIMKLAPFNRQQALGYFDKFFGDNLKYRDRAKTIYSGLIKSSVPPSGGGPREQFVNLPLCIGMIAQYINYGGDNPINITQSKGVLRTLLYQICEREKERKNLYANADTQLSALEEIAVDQIEAIAPEFELELLEIAGIDEGDVKKLKDHPLLITDDGVKYRFKYDFLSQYLRAYNITNAIQNGNARLKDNLWNLMVLEANGKGHLIEHISGLWLLADLNKIKNCYRVIPQKYFEAKSFIFHLVNQLLRNSSNFVNKSEKSNAIFTMFCDDFESTHRIQDLYVTGIMEGLDLSGIKFKSCTFSDTLISGCDANKSTIFEECRFLGELDFQNCGNFKSIRLNNYCTLSPQANLAWGNILEARLGTKEDLITDALRLALSKFWHHGQPKWSIRKEDWYRGILVHSIYCDKIRRAMIKSTLIAETEINGKTGGGFEFDKNSLSDLQQFMDNRLITGKIREVYNYLLKN